MTTSDPPREPVRLDRALLALRDHLELTRAEGDLRAAELLPKVRRRISERARQACLDAEQDNQ